MLIVFHVAHLLDMSGIENREVLDAQSKMPGCPDSLAFCLQSYAHVFQQLNLLMLLLKCILYRPNCTISVTLAMTEKVVHTQEFSVRVNSRALFGHTVDLNALVSECCLFSVHRGVFPMCYLV